MKKFFSLLWGIIFSFLFVSTVYAGAEEVEVVKLTRNIYHNVDGYGWYKKCQDFSWFGFVLNNPTGQSFTVTMPNKASITGWSGTSHKIDTFTYKLLDSIPENFLTINRNIATPFDQSFTLPAHSICAVFFNVNNMAQYNLYWDTDIFFKFKIDSREVPIQGILSQHGNACSEDQVCTAEMLDAAYNSDGGDGQLTVKIRNAMPDIAEITADKALTFRTIDTAGNILSESVKSNAITWDTGHFWLEAGKEKTITGMFTLPDSVAGSNSKLNLKTHFSFPSSMFFGDFYSEGIAEVRGGVHGILNGSFDTDGKNGVVTARLTNHLNQKVTVTLPTSGKLSGSGNTAGNVSLSWGSVPSAVTLDPDSTKSFIGSITFTDRSLISANRELNMTALFPYKPSTGEALSFSAAGVLSRNPEPNPVIRSLGLCREITAGSREITVSYTLENSSNIDISVQLAGTLAVEGITRNPSVSYTGCESGGKSCLNRVSGSTFVLKSGETATLTGVAEAESNITKADASVSTSLIYNPDDQTKVLYVGKSTASCLAAVSPANPTDMPAVPTTAPASPAVPTDIPSVPTSAPVFPAVPTGIPSVPTSAPVSPVIPTDMPAVPTTAPVSPAVPTDMPSVPTTAPSVLIVPTFVPAEPSIPTETPNAILTVSGRPGYYSPCERNTVHFSYTISNHGMGSAELDMSRIHFTIKGSGSALAPEYLSCVQQTGAGTDPSCINALPNGVLTLQPGSSMSMNLTVSPDTLPNAESFVISGVSTEYPEIAFDVEITRDESSCNASIAPVVEEGVEEPLDPDISPDGKTVTLRLVLANNGYTDTEVDLNTIFLHDQALTNYLAIVEILPIESAVNGKDLLSVSGGSSFTLPAASYAVIELSLPVNANISGSIPLNWNMTVGGVSQNYTGTLNLRQGTAPVPAPTSPAGPGVSSLTGSTGTAAPNVELFRLNVPDLDVNLPSTGFPTTHSVPLSVQPAELAYRELNGLHIEIPVLYSSADIVSVPLNEAGNWAIEWLGSRAALQQGNVLPGEGTAMVAAHNHLDQMNTGPFLFLADLQENDRIFVTDDGGKLLRFRVYRNEAVDPASGSEIYNGVIPGSLILVTCEDELPDGGYAYRRLVYAEPMQ